MANYRLSGTARGDLSDIAANLAADCVDGAVRQHRRFERAFEIIAGNPRAGEERYEIGPDVRSFPIDTYSALYRAHGGLTIIRIVSATRDLNDGLGDLI